MLEASSESTGVTERQRKDHSRVATPPAGESRVATPPARESRAAQRPALLATQATSQVNRRSSLKEPDLGHQPSQHKRQCGGTRPGLRCPSLPWQVLIGSDSVSVPDFVHHDSKCTGRACAALSLHPRHVDCWICLNHAKPRLQRRQCGPNQCTDIWSQVAVPPGSSLQTAPLPREAFTHCSHCSLPLDCFLVRLTVRTFLVHRSNGRDRMLRRQITESTPRKQRPEEGEHGEVLTGLATSGEGPLGRLRS